MKYVTIAFKNQSISNMDHDYQWLKAAIICGFRYHMVAIGESLKEDPLIDNFVSGIFIALLLIMYVLDILNEYDQSLNWSYLFCVKKLFK